MNAMYSVEQIRTPPELGTVMKQYTKAILRDRPQNVYKYSANFFALLCGQTEPFDEEGQLVHDGKGEHDAVAHNTTTAHHASDTPLTVLDTILAKYDTTKSGYIQSTQLPALLDDLAQAMSADDANELPSADDIMTSLGNDAKRIDLLELRHLLRLTE